MYVPRWLLVKIFFAVMLYFGASCSFAYEVTQEQIEFVNKLKNATKAEDKEWISSVIAYPALVILENGDRMQIKNKLDFITNYDVIFHANVKDAILKQEIADLFFNWQGLMVGHGQVWIWEETKEKDIREFHIITINAHAPPVRK